METESAVLSAIAQAFPQLNLAEATTNPRRIFLTTPLELFLKLLSFAAQHLGFKHLCTITGLDSGQGYEFIYHIADERGILLNIKYLTPGGDGVIIPSVLPIYAGATFYERELEGLLGVTVSGLPEGRQYPLPDNWPEGQYPLRKDWVPSAAPAATYDKEAE